MPSTTSGYKLPWPLGTDRLMDGDDQIRKLAQSVENCVQNGSGVAAVNAAGSGTVDVTFSPPFLSAPIVVACTNNGAYYANVTAVTTTGCTIRANHRDNTNATANITCYFIAVGPVTTVA